MTGTRQVVLFEDALRDRELCSEPGAPYILRSTQLAAKYRQVMIDPSRLLKP